MDADKLEKQRAAVRKSYWKHREKRIQYHREYRKNNPDIIRAGKARWNALNKDKVVAHAKKSRLKNLYGLTVEQFDELNLKQGGLCLICGQPEPVSAQLHVDHDHDSGRVRGLLCIHCNTGLGKFKHSPELLDKAKKYLLTH